MFVKRMFTAAAAAAACLFLLSSAACAPAYVPAEGEIYFRDGDVYRVISQSGEGNAVEGKVVDVISPFVLADPVQSFGVVFTYTYGAGSLFAEKAGVANEEGAAAVYDALGMEGKTLAEEPYLAAEPLYAWSGRMPQEDHWVNLAHPSDYTGAVALGYMADGTEYTFSYEDRSVESGEVTGSGSFTVFIADVVYISVIED